MVQLLGPGSTLPASFDGAWHLSKMLHAEIRFRMSKRLACKRACDGLGAGHPKVVEVVGVDGMREIAIDHSPCEIRAIAGKAIKMTLVGS